MQALDMDYDDLFTCQLCLQQGASIIIDGKEMGISKALSRPYARPMSANAASVPVTRSAMLPCSAAFPRSTVLVQLSTVFLHAVLTAQ